MFPILINLSPILMAQRGNPNTSYMGESPDQMVSKFMEEYNVPGLTLAIVEAPYIPLYAGYGVAQIEPYSQTLSLASPKTLFNIGQMSQGYIAIYIMQLIEKDKINSITIKEKKMSKSLLKNSV